MIKQTFTIEGLNRQQLYTALELLLTLTANFSRMNDEQLHRWREFLTYATNDYDNENASVYCKIKEFISLLEDTEYGPIIAEEKAVLPQAASNMLNQMRQQINTVESSTPQE